MKKIDAQQVRQQINPFNSTSKPSLPLKKTNKQDKSKQTMIK